jgi:flavin-dependent dehydrogenase
MRYFDVVILGAGPAGATTALALRKFHPHLSVVMVEACDYQTLRQGEILTKEAIPILQQLDVLDFFLEQNHPQWQTAPRANDEATSTHEFGAAVGLQQGWQLDRTRFDGMLAGYAAASGASFIRASMTEARFMTDNSWQIVTQSALHSRVLNTAFVVDATGRSARFAGEIGVPHAAHDTLVGVGRALAMETEDPSDQAPLIEAFEHGWWYSAPTADNRLAVVAMTDADICKRLQLAHTARWSELLQASPQTQRRVARLKVAGEVNVRAAHTRCLRSCCGKNWLAVGDAATSVDPISAHGIVRALRFGMHASDAIGGHFGDRRSSLGNYEALVHTEFEQNLSLRADIYRSESRWENAPFWRRRHHISSSTPGGWAQWKSTLTVSNGLSGSGLRAAEQTAWAPPRQ